VRRFIQSVGGIYRAGGIDEGIEMNTLALAGRRQIEK
jgi:hypothetical protein